MNEIIQKISSFFSELREKDDQTKKQWLIGLTSASMLIVLGLWILSLNSTIKKLGEVEESQPENGLGATLYQGMKIIRETAGKEIGDASDRFQNLIKTTNSVTIQPTNLDFSNNIKPVTPKKFP